MVALLSNMFDQLRASSSWNEFQIKKNLFGIIVLYAIHYLFSLVPFGVVDRAMSSQLLLFAETLAFGYFAYNVWSHLPIKNVPFPLRDYLFQSGAFEKAIIKWATRANSMLWNRYNTVRSESSKSAPVKSAPAPPPKAESAPLTAPATAPATTISSQQGWFGPLDPPVDNKAKAVMYPTWMPQSTCDPSYKIAVPMHEIRPAHITPKKQTTRTNKTLWRLMPQPQIVERFRQEQYLDFDKNWHRFDNRSSKIYYERLHQWIKDYILKPLVRTVELVEKQLPPNTGSNYIDCPINILAMLIIDPSTVDDSALPVALVQKMLVLPSYENDRARKYVLARVQELAKQSRFRLLVTHENNVPSDQEIIFHLFKSYITYTMPSVIPPLLPLQGEIFKFLLIYFYITEEISNDIFF